MRGNKMGTNLLLLYESSIQLSWPANKKKDTRVLRVTPKKTKNEHERQHLGLVRVNFHENSNCRKKLSAEQNKDIIHCQGQGKGTFTRARNIINTEI